nr:uncharacterized protein LOC123769934 isoform X2 [Procambarus clarkii]
MLMSTVYGGTSKALYHTRTVHHLGWLPRIPELVKMSEEQLQGYLCPCPPSHITTGCPSQVFEVARKFSHLNMCPLSPLIFP